MSTLGYAVNFTKVKAIAFNSTLGAWKHIFSTEEYKKSGREPITFTNDIDVIDEKTIFFTDSSSKWDRRRFPGAFFEQKANGRQFKG